jgi:hypothetical protein
MCLLRPLRLLRRPSPPNPWWLCGVTTVQAKRKQKLLLAAMAAAMAVLASAARVPVETVVPVARVIEAVTVLVTAVHAVMFAKTEGHAWEMPLSVPSAKPWSVPKCRCANWPHKRTAKR